MSKHLVAASKFLSLVLRHRPATIGIELDSNGWVTIDELIDRANKHHSTHNDSLTFDKPLIEEIVATCPKQRFAISEDGLRIRANQGHSVRSVDLELTPVVPPDRLFHGTVEKSIEGIAKEGLLKRSRNHVHLSGDVETAKQVGNRRGKPIVLTILADEMHAHGIDFYQSVNGVWLVEQVPANFIEMP